MNASTLHLPACCTPVEASELPALDGGCCHGHGCAAPSGGHRHSRHHDAAQDPACPWQHPGRGFLFAFALTFRHKIGTLYKRSKDQPAPQAAGRNGGLTL